MPTQISKHAQLSFAYGETTGKSVSNSAAVTILDSLVVAKKCFGTQYRIGEELTYILTLENNSTRSLTDIQISDDLGSFMTGNALLVTPLTYTGPAYLLVDGLFFAELPAEVSGHSVNFTIAALAAACRATVLYKAVVNEYAPYAPSSVIENTAVVTAPALNESKEASATASAENYVDVRIVKSMYPNPVTEGDNLTYDFAIYNYGNTVATDVVLTDTLISSPGVIAVSVDGVPVDSSQFDYADAVFMLPNAKALLSITIPAATFTQDPITGAYTVEPGMVSIIVRGGI